MMTPMLAKPETPTPPASCVYHGMFHQSWRAQADRGTDRKFGLLSSIRGGRRFPPRMAKRSLRKSCATRRYRGRPPMSLHFRRAVISSFPCLATLCEVLVNLPCNADPTSRGLAAAASPRAPPEGALDRSRARTRTSFSKERSEISARVRKGPARRTRRCPRSGSTAYRIRRPRCPRIHLGPSALGLPRRRVP